MDNERFGRPKKVIEENIELVHSLIMCDIAGQIGVRFEPIQSILTDILGLSKLSAGWVSRMSIKDQKKRRLDISKYHLSLYEDDPEEFSVEL